MKPIKPILGACMLCVLLASPAMSELTPGDLDKIRLIVNESEKRVKAEIKAEIKEELKPIKDDIGVLKVEVANVKAEVASVKNEVAWIRGRIVGMEQQFDSVEKQITHTTNLTYGLIVLIVVAVGIPQIIMTWRSRSERALERRMEAMAQELETLKQQRIARP